MQSNTYTAFLGLIFFIALNFLVLPNVQSQEEGDIFDLRFLTELDCGENILTAKLQIRTQDDTFKIGISSVLFNYDETVLEFLEYNSLNFDKNNICIPGVPLAVWDNHQFSSSTPGVFNLTLLTEIASQSCPIIEQDWIDIGIIRFTVKNMAASPNMQFDTRNTTFNRNIPNDGTFSPNQGDLMGFNEILDSQCGCETPTVIADTLEFDCPDAFIEANVLSNDITTNPIITITSNPTKGTAAINPNGTLTYTPTTPFCGEDVLTYQVCNDGDERCCSEAVVTISLLDNLPPLFVNAPSDMTIDCGELEPMGDIEVEDNCDGVEVVKNEIIQEGNCPEDAAYMRTWTAVDACGNQSTHTQVVMVIDQTPPVIECPATFSTSCEGLSLDGIDSNQPSFSDNCTPESDLIVSFSDEIITENCENFIQKQIERTWSVTDACGNLATCIQTINIIDDFAPVITCPRDITVDCGSDINPENLESKATAFDSCSTVTVTFVDDEAMPTDCSFSTKTITRTWTAVDACGNSSNCTQSITVAGNPCPETITKDLTVYRCEKEIVSFKAILAIGDSLTLSISDKNTQEPIFNTQQYALPSTGCQIGQFEFTYEIYNAQQCLIENGTLIITTIPNFIGEAVLSEDGCTASLILECPDLYSVSWTAGTDSGQGTTYTATPGTSGEVVFSVIFIDETLPSETASLPCVELLLRVNYNCETNCPETINEQLNLTTCVGQTFDLIELLDLSEDSLGYTFSMANPVSGVNFGEIPSELVVGNPFGCELGTFTMVANGYDANECLVKSIVISSQVLPKIEGFIQYQTDSTFCSPQLILECSDLYTIEWADNSGNSGEGDTYIGTSGTSGFVTFYVYPINEHYRELPCAVDSFFADFSCPIICPEPIERTVLLSACAETEINLIDRLNLNTNNEYIFDDEAITTGIYQVGNPFGCNLGRKMFTIESFDENQCLIEIITLHITVIPAVYGDVNTTTDVACNLLLNLECPENYTVTWEDSHGNTGEGLSYMGENGTSGSVVFTATYKADIAILNNENLPCSSRTFEGNYECITNVECPTIVTENKELTFCNNDYINIAESLDISPNAIYKITGLELDNFGNIQLINEDCTIITKEFTASIFDTLDCLIKEIKVTLNISPTISARIQYETDSTYCLPKLLLDCADAFEVTWTDNLGNTGEGMTYEGITDTAGFVTFVVTPLAEFSEVFCGNDSFTADFSCQKTEVDCPEPAFETIDLYGCDGEIFNLFERLDFSDNTRYRIVDGDEVEDINNIRLENDGADCFIRQFRLAIEVIDARGCITKSIFVSFNVLPAIKGEIVGVEEGCGVELSLICPNIYAISWEDNLGNQGEGFTYEPEFGTVGLVNFIVSYKDSSVVQLFEDSTCFRAEFSHDFSCCNPAGTACDDGDALTFGDIEDGNCGCFGTGCDLENKGTVIDGSGLDGCDLLVEMSDGTILEPAVLPVGETLAIGQEIIFSFIELTDRVSICQAGKIIQIICFENTCPIAGTPCTDNDLSTINDVEDGNCNCVGETAPEVKSEIDLRFRPELDCQANTYCVTLQAKAQQEDFTIGTSSIMVNYDSDALEFASYISHQFDEEETCIGGTTSPWDVQKFDGTSVPGKFCLTMTLLTDDVSCPEITTEEWEDIGLVCFDIMNNDTTPALKFDGVNTHFNSSTPNDGSRPIGLGTLHGIDADEALACAGNTIVSANELAIKAFLQGPFKVNKSLMDDDLRKKGFIPLTEPYTGIPSFIHFGEGGGESVTTEVLEVSGDNAIVDWVFLELRAGSDSTLVVATRSALIQRDGDVVEVDGESNVKFVVPDGAYYVTIKHRNHLGIMTAEPMMVTTTNATIIDFTIASTTTYGSYAQLELGDKMALRGGNTNPDKFIILAGGGLGLPDRDMIFFDIFLSLWQSNPEVPITYNSVLHGYFGSDTNMDGKVKYQGPRNDIDAYIFFNVLFHPLNTEYRLNFAILEQIP